MCQLRAAAHQRRLIGQVSATPNAGRLLAGRTVDPDQAGLALDPQRWQGVEGPAPPGLPVHVLVAQDLGWPGVLHKPGGQIRLVALQPDYFMGTDRRWRWRLQPDGTGVLEAIGYTISAEPTPTWADNAPIVPQIEALINQPGR